MRQQTNLLFCVTLRPRSPSYRKDARSTDGMLFTRHQGMAAYVGWEPRQTYCHQYNCVDLSLCRAESPNTPFITDMVQAGLPIHTTPLYHRNDRLVVVYLGGRVAP